MRLLKRRLAKLDLKECLHEVESLAVDSLKFLDPKDWEIF